MARDAPFIRERSLTVRVLFATAAYLVSLPLVAAGAFFAVLFLAGPHGGLLPAAFEKPVLIVGWLAVLVLPAWIARAVWRWSDTRVPSDS